MDIKAIKTSEHYRLEKDHKGVQLAIDLEVDLDNEERTMSLRTSGDSKKFEFTKSDPFLVAEIASLIEKATEVTHRVKR